MITFGPVPRGAVLHLAYLCQALTATVLLVSFFLSETAPETQMEFTDQTCNALLFALTVFAIQYHHRQTCFCWRLMPHLSQPV